MKTAYLAFLFTVGHCGISYAQLLQFYLFTGYGTQAVQQMQTGSFRVSGGQMLGMAVGLGGTQRTDRNAICYWELEYSYRKTMFYYTGDVQDTRPVYRGMNVHQIMFGPMAELTVERCSFLAGPKLGVVAFSPESNTSATAFIPALGLNSGMQLALNERIGLRFQGQFMLPFLSNNKPNDWNYDDAEQTWSMPGYALLHEFQCRSLFKHFTLNCRSAIFIDN